MLKISITSFGYLCIAVLVFAAMEFALRYIYSPPAVQMRIEVNRLSSLAIDSRLDSPVFDYENFRFHPHSERSIKHPEYSYVATHDEHGWRNPCYSPVDLSEVDIFLLGDSFVYGIGIDDTHTFNCLSSVRDRNQTTAQYLYSLGLEGATPQHYLKMYDLYLKNSAKDNAVLIFAFFLGNDKRGFHYYFLRMNHFF